MITFEEACDYTVDFYKKAWDVDKLSKALDLGEKWIIYPYTDAVFGVTFYTISKKDGSMAPFILPDKENFELLDKAVEVEIPSKYLAQK